MKEKLGITFIAFIGILLFSVSNAKAVTFNPNLIISDDELLDSSAMSLEDIKQFLNAKGGYISTYVTQNFEGTLKSAAQIIYDAAANNYDCDDAINLTDKPSEAEKKIKCEKISINPKFLLVLLQKEQSLIEETNPTQTQLDWATGYGCPDNQACNDRWRGFGKQVNSAALQFYHYMTHPEYYIFKAGNTYTVNNTNNPPTVIKPLNQATAALYNYTPHVYYGNYNFYKIWLRYFTHLYPNNTLLQAKGEGGIWLIQNGEKRPFFSKGALTSRFDINKVVQVSKADLDKYPTGDPIKYPQYSLLRSPAGTVFLLVDDKRRGFASAEAFRKIGYNPEEVIDASWEDINTYIEGVPLTATSSYPTGALLQDKSTGGVYWVSDGTKAPLWDAILLKTKYRGKSITQESSEKLASFKTVEPAIFDDGELIKSNISPAVYVIDNKTKRAFVSGKIFEDLGYKWNNIISVPQKILDLYPDGTPIKESYLEEEVSLEVEAPELSNTPANCENSTDPSCQQATTTPTNESSIQNGGQYSQQLQEQIEDMLSKLQS